MPGEVDAAGKRQVPGCAHRRRGRGPGDARTALPARPARQDRSGVPVNSRTAKRPSVSVPVLSSSRCGRAGRTCRTSVLPIKMPRAAAAPTPVVTASGVARPRAQGQAMTSTVTARTRQSAGEWPSSSKLRPVSSGQGDHGRDKAAGDLVGPLLHRGFGGQRVFHQSNHLRQRRFRAGAGHFHRQRRIGGDRAAGHFVPEPFGHRPRFAGQQAFVYQRRAFGNAPVAGDTLAGPDKHPVAHAQFAEGDQDSRARRRSSPAPFSAAGHTAAQSRRSHPAAPPLRYACRSAPAPPAYPPCRSRHGRRPARRPRHCSANETPTPSVISVSMIAAPRRAAAQALGEDRPAGDQHRQGQQHLNARQPLDAHRRTAPDAGKKSA